VPSRLKGWPWKSLPRAEGEGQSNWLARLFATEDTPLTDLLASPGKQGRGGRSGPLPAP
jgi:hypothetical protein